MTNSTLAWARTFPPSESEGWTLTSIERESRYWSVAQVGLRETKLFERGVFKAWQWAVPAQFIRFFSDGERRYGQELWKLAAVWLKRQEWPASYRHRKVWREGLEVAIKIKGSQGRPRRVWLQQEHPFTAISPAKEVHANHNEAHNASIRRRCSAYRRQQNHYAKSQSGLQRAISVLRLIHNWVRPHSAFGKSTTPAMYMGFVGRAVTMMEFLNSRGFQDFTN